MLPAASSSSSAPCSSPTQEEIMEHMPLVRQVVAWLIRRLPPNVQREDLIAAGSYGLFDALRRSSSRGPAFEWYARVRIRGAAVDELRSQDWLTRRARHRVAKAQAEGTSRGAAVVSFDDLPEAQANGFADESTPTPDAQIERRMERAALERAVALLPEREANIVSWHYFDDVPFKVIAGRLGVSEPRVSQLHSRAMGMLRERLAEPKPVRSVAA